jgi:hypothetical protein
MVDKISKTGGFAMNHSTSNWNGNGSTSNSLPLRTAITGFLNYKTAEGLSQRSVDSYKRILEQWAEYAGNEKVNQFTDHDLNAYLVYMRTEYVPRRFGAIHAYFLQSHYEIFGSPCVPSSLGRKGSFGWKTR